MKIKVTQILMDNPIVKLSAFLHHTGTPPFYAAPLPMSVKVHSLVNNAGKT